MDRLCAAPASSESTENPAMAVATVPRVVAMLSQARNVRSFAALGANVDGVREAQVSRQPHFNAIRVRITYTASGFYYTKLNIARTKVGLWLYPKGNFPRHLVLGSLGVAQRPEELVRYLR